MEKLDDMQVIHFLHDFFFHFCCLRFSVESKEKGIPQGKEDNKDGDDKEEDKKKHTTSKL